jgi:hypothetical protein
MEKLDDKDILIRRMVTKNSDLIKKLHNTRMSNKLLKAYLGLSFGALAIFILWSKA